MPAHEARRAAAQGRGESVPRPRPAAQGPRRRKPRDRRKRRSRGGRPLGRTEGPEGERHDLGVGGRHAAAARGAVRHVQPAEDEPVRRSPRSRGSVESRATNGTGSRGPGESRAGNGREGRGVPRREWTQPHAPDPAPRAVRHALESRPANGSRGVDRCRRQPRAGGVPRREWRGSRVPGANGPGRTWSQMKRSARMVPSKRARAPQLARRSCRYRMMFRDASGFWRPPRRVPPREWKPLGRQPLPVPRREWKPGGP